MAKILFKLIFTLTIITLLIQPVHSLDPHEASIVNYAKTISVISLILLIPHTIFFKRHFRLLQFLQIMYLYSNQKNHFINSLNYSCFTFMPNFLGSKFPGDFIDQAGFAISISVIIILIILSAYIIITIHNLFREKKIWFFDIYRFLKGFIKWFYLILTYYSLSYVFNFKIISFLNSEIPQDTFFTIPMILVMLCTIFPFIQVALTYSTLLKRNQQNTSECWIQFFSYLRILFLNLFVNIYTWVNFKPWFLVYGVIIGYTLLIGLLYMKTDALSERIIFLIVQIFHLILFSIIVGNNKGQGKNQATIGLITIIFLLQIGNQICRYWKLLMSRNSEKNKINEINNIKNDKNNMQHEIQTHLNVHNQENNNELIKLGVEAV